MKKITNAENFIPEQQRSDHLLLLVGTNPLPNWVAARLLLKPGGCVHLFYTSGVSKQMERLRDVLKEDGISVSSFETADSDDAQIFENVCTRAESLKKETGKVIGLNYTGGTKMMSVHAHRALHSLNLNQSLSYLDARTLSLKFDSATSIEVALAPEVCISLGKLLRLHEDYESRNVRYDTTAKCAEAAQGLVEIHSNYSGQCVWRKWCQKLVENVDARRLRRDPAYYRQTVSRLDQVRFHSEADFKFHVERHLKGQKKYAPPAVQMILRKITAGYQKLLAELKVAEGDRLLEVIKQNPQFTDSIEVARWVDGMWLEHYTLSQIEECRKDAQINAGGLALNLETKNESGRKFEADVVALRGYQLFYFSCYSGSEFDRSKSKLFEAMVRSAQLAGDEARFALVGCTDAAENVCGQIEADWGKVGQVAVFGRDSLPKLKDKLLEWFIRKPKTNQEGGI